MSDLDDIISSDNGFLAVRLPGSEPSQWRRRWAAKRLHDSEIAGDLTVAEILREAEIRELREHTHDRDLENCGCEDEGWFCPKGDGPATYWLCLAP